MINRIGEFQVHSNRVTYIARILHKRKEKLVTIEFLDQARENVEKVLTFRNVEKYSESFFDKSDRRDVGKLLEQFIGFTTSASGEKNTHFVNTDIREIKIVSTTLPELETFI
jgi:hypothetical protein